MESKNELEFRELTGEELDQVAGGNPIGAALITGAAMIIAAKISTTAKSCPAE